MGIFFLFSHLQKQFRMKDLGDLRYFIGIEEYNPYCGYIDHEPTEARELLCPSGRLVLAFSILLNPNPCFLRAYSIRPMLVCPIGRKQWPIANARPVSSFSVAHR